MPGRSEIALYWRETTHRPFFFMFRLVVIIFGLMDYLDLVRCLVPNLRQRFVFMVTCNELMDYSRV